MLFCILITGISAISRNGSDVRFIMQLKIPFSRLPIYVGSSRLNPYEVGQWVMFNLRDKYRIVHNRQPRLLSKETSPMRHGAIIALCHSTVGLSDPRHAIGVFCSVQPSRFITAGGDHICLFLYYNIGTIGPIRRHTFQVNGIPRNRSTLGKGCVEVLCQSGAKRWQPETTPGVFT